MAYNIADLIEHTVDTVPDRTALVCGDRRITYAELEERANRLAHSLAEQGVGRGSHIGVYSRNSIEFVETMVAAFKLRAVPININYRYVEDELRYIFDNADLVALVHERRYAPLVESVLPDTPMLEHVLVIEDGTDEDYASYGGVEYESALSAGSPLREFEPRSADDIYILYTGGTTGYPKGVIYRHEDIWRVLMGGIDFTTGQRIEDEWQQARSFINGGLVGFPIPPLMHGAAQAATMRDLFQGCTVVLTPKFDPAECWRIIERERVNVVLVTGDAMARPLIEAYRQGEHDPSSLVAVASSAAIFSPSVKEQYLELLPNVVITDSIGSSETGFSGITMVDKNTKYRGGGPTVALGPDTLVLGEDGRPVGVGEVGKVARSGNIPLGYYKDPEKTAATFVEIDGKRYAIPGDYARVEDETTITLLGRGSICINTGGEKVYPEEVEGALKSHPDVFDCLVVGVPDDRWGQKVTAVVQPRPGKTPTLDALVAHARTKVAGYKVPRELFLVDEVRRLPSGKPDYPWAQAYARTRSGLVTQES